MLIMSSGIKTSESARLPKILTDNRKGVSSSVPTTPRQQNEPHKLTRILVFVLFLFLIHVKHHSFVRKWSGYEILIDKWMNIKRIWWKGFSISILESDEIETQRHLKCWWICPLQHRGSRQTRLLILGRWEEEIDQVCELSSFSLIYLHIFTLQLRPSCQVEF